MRKNRVKQIYVEQLNAMKEWYKRVAKAAGYPRDHWGWWAGDVPIASQEAIEEVSEKMTRNPNYLDDTLHRIAHEWELALGEMASMGMTKLLREAPRALGNAGTDVLCYFHTDLYDRYLFIGMRQAISKFESWQEDKPAMLLSLKGYTARVEVTGHIYEYSRGGYYGYVVESKCGRILFEATDIALVDAKNRLVVVDVSR